ARSGGGFVPALAGNAPKSCRMTFAKYDGSREEFMLTIEVEREDDGRWIAEIPDLPGVMAYGQTRQEAIEKVQVLSLRVLADRLEHGERVPGVEAVFAVAG